MVIDFTTRQPVIEEPKEEMLTVGDIVAYLNSFGPELGKVLDVPVMIGENKAKDIEFSSNSLVIK